MAIPEIYLDLTSRLAKLRRAEQGQQWRAAFGVMLLGGALLFLCAPVLVHWKSENAYWRWLLTGASLIAAGYLLWLGVLQPLLKRVAAAPAHLDVDLA